MDAYLRCLGEGTTSDIKITRDEAISAYELNEICAFLLLTTFKELSFCQPKHQHEEIAAEDNFYHERAANPKS